jgi:S-formylglutathione hydrolase FrmB
VWVKMKDVAKMLCALLLLLKGRSAAVSDDIRVSPASRDDRGFLIHSFTSPYQAPRTDVRVLLPDRMESGRRYPVVYVLPVEAGREDRYGDGLSEVQKHDLHNQRAAIFVAPSFSHLPWYADHPTRPEIRQESYFVKVVVPFVEKTYAASGRSEDRLLLGFSKSGWGAWSLLLRHPEMFGRAAAWDAPLMMKEIGLYGTSEILGTQKNFEAYRVADLLRTNAELLRDRKRLDLMGFDNFRPHHQQAHTLLEELRIPHEYRDGPARKHDWHSGWVPEAVELLFAGINESPARER